MTDSRKSQIHSAQEDLHILITFVAAVAWDDIGHPSTDLVFVGVSIPWHWQCKVIAGDIVNDLNVTIIYCWIQLVSHRLLADELDLRDVSASVDYCAHQSEC